MSGQRMSDPRLDDLGRRIREAEKKYAHHIHAHTSRILDRQIAETGKGICFCRVEVVDGKVFVSPVYPKVPA